MIFTKVVDVFAGVCYLIVTERNESNAQEGQPILNAVGSSQQPPQSKKGNAQYVSKAFALRANKQVWRYLNQNPGDVGDRSEKDCKSAESEVHK